ncbi:PAS domain-containing hybrid sensor histidine kinase/response regulator [Piscinibacter koreensis]|uniref:histidine kinase n=1 Tax=Piscinibacter koreensis TaxID=2742824 RepID=A0A7Y6NMD6_9BURK|nr:PAS domain S-box protein [Schlegelella koreensis]NUZ05863.1 PAS domain S-box protein [Schlegelella koreensis]
MDPDDVQAMQLECAELRARLDEAEATLAAIRGGDVDALVIGDHVYTLDSANAASNSLRKDVLAQMQDAVVACDDDGRVIYMNPAAERQYRRSMSEALGHPRRELFTETWTDAASEARSLDSLQRHGTYRAHSIHTRRDGSRLHVEATVSRLEGADGASIGHLAVIRDISERVQNEESLRAATEALARRERQFATLVENSPDVLARFDRELRHRYVSPVVERYTGLRPDQFIGKTNLELGMDAALGAQLSEAAERVFQTGQVGRTKFRVRAVDGTDAVFEARIVPEFADDGGIESVLSIAADVTEQEAVDAARRAAEASLRESDRRKDEFLATLAHELRNPLAPIRNALGLMRLSTDGATHANARAVIERQLLQMVHLVDDLLDVGRISQGKLELRRDSVDVAAAVQAAVETSRPLIDAGRHQLTMHLPPPGALRVDADATRLTQIVANLLNNAAKYTPEGGRIEVAATRDGPDALISVSDSGVGIPPDMLPQVFDMFAQVNRTLDRAQGGLGIGLALVKQLVELHGGSVVASSAGDGRGSTFTVRIPALDAPREGDPGAPLGVAACESEGECRVLVVDDNVDSAESLAKVLELLGFQTRTAFDGGEAVRIAAEFEPKVALLDLGLPVLSGFEVATRLREADPAVTLVAISGWGQADDRRRSAAAGFDHHFVKPVDIDALLRVLTRARQPA